MSTRISRGAMREDGFCKSPLPDNSSYAPHTNAQTTATTTAGRRFAVLNVLPQMRFTPTQKMSMEPTSERLFRAPVVIMGWIKRASKVMVH